MLESGAYQRTMSQHRGSFEIPCLSEGGRICAVM